MSAAVVAEIAQLLAKGIVSGIGSAIGAQIFNSIFTTGVPSYFTEVYKEIERIVHQEITQNTIDEINGQINGLTDWVQNVYLPRKDQGVSKQELYDLMTPKESDIAIHMVAVLQEKAFAESALAVFVIGASIHLVLLQELALVDPAVTDPSLSSYLESVRRYANDYAEHSEKTYNQIIKERTSDSVITSVYETSQAFPPFPGQPPQTHMLFIATWKDSFINKEFTDNTELLNGQWLNGTVDDLRDRANKARKEYIHKLIDDLNTALNDPVGVSASWRKLTQNPLPHQ